MNKLEVCLSPSMFREYNHTDSIVVIIDTLRASSAICWALHNGADRLISVGSVEEARSYKAKGYTVAAERDGFVLDFADFGNSPFNFTADRVKGKAIAYSTTNGTKCIKLASSAWKVVVASFINITSVSNWLTMTGKDVILLCAGWKNKVNIEDSVLAGAIASRLVESTRYETICDSAKIAIDLWHMAEKNLLGYIEKAAQRSRLRDKGLDECIEFCHTPDQTEVIPVLAEEALVRLEDQQ